MKKFRLLVVLLVMLLAAGLLVGCDEAMLEEMLEEQGFDTERMKELEEEMEALQDRAESLKMLLPQEDRWAFEDRLQEKMEQEFGDRMAELEKQMEEMEAGLEQRLEAGEIDEMEAIGLMMESMVDFYGEMLPIMEEMVPHMRLVLDELAEEFQLDPTALPEIVPGTMRILMTVNEPLVKLNGQDYMLDQAPVISEGRTLVPLRFIGEALGAYVEWNEEDWTVSYATAETRILLAIDDPTAYVNGTAVEMDVAPTIINGRTMVPVRFISENMGFQTDWISETRQVVISKVQ